MFLLCLLSFQSLLSIRQDDKVVCPRTKEVFNFSQAEKVYIMWSLSWTRLSVNMIEHRRSSPVTWPIQRATCGAVIQCPLLLLLLLPSPTDTPDISHTPPTHRLFSQYIMISSSLLVPFHPHILSHRNWTLSFQTLLDVARKQEVDPFKHMDYQHCHYFTDPHSRLETTEKDREGWNKLLGRFDFTTTNKNLLRLLFPFSSGVPLLLK